MKTRGEENRYVPARDPLAHIDTDTLASHMHALAARMGASVALGLSVPDVPNYDWRGMKRAVIAMAHAMVEEHRAMNGDANTRRVMSMLTDAIIAEVHAPRRTEDAHERHA